TLRIANTLHAGSALVIGGGESHRDAGCVPTGWTGCRSRTRSGHGRCEIKDRRFVNSHIDNRHPISIAVQRSRHAVESRWGRVFALVPASIAGDPRSRWKSPPVALENRGSAEMFPFVPVGFPHVP